MTTIDYLRGRETVRRRELWYGAILVREAAPRFEHQLAVTRLAVLLDRPARLRSDPDDHSCTPYFL